MGWVYSASWIWLTIRSRIWLMVVGARQQNVSGYELVSLNISGNRITDNIPRETRLPRPLMITTLPSPKRLIWKWRRLKSSCWLPSCWANNSTRGNGNGANKVEGRGLVRTHAMCKRPAADCRGRSSHTHTHTNTNTQTLTHKHSHTNTHAHTHTHTQPQTHKHIPADCRGRSSQKSYSLL